MTAQILCSHNRIYQWASTQPHVLNVWGNAETNPPAPQMNPIHGDNSGNHISQLNPYFSEFTTIWWAWKNKHLTADVIELAHFRAWLAPQSMHARKEPTIHCTADQLSTYNVDSEEWCEQMQTILQTYDAIMPIPWDFAWNIREQFLSCYTTKQWQTTLDSLDEPAAAKYFETHKGVVAGNLGIMKKELWEEYFNWIFPIMFQIHSRITDYPETWDVTTSRIPAASAERLQTWWLHSRGLKIKWVPMILGAR